MTKEPTWKETLEMAREMKRKKLAPMLKAMIEVNKEKEKKDGSK